MALPFLAGKKTMNHFFATDYTDFHRFFLLKSAQIRETPHWRAAPVFVAVVLAFPLKTVEPNLFSVFASRM